MKPNLKIIHFCILFISALLLIGCTAPTEVEVTREVVVTRVVEKIVEETASAEPASDGDKQVISVPYTVDTYNGDFIVETMKSEAFAEAFRIYTILPLSYEDNPDKRYQTLYIMDGNFNTHLANLLTWNLGILGLVPDIVIVGVGFDTDSLSELEGLREQDYYPPEYQDGYGRADDLLAFMQNELVSHIDSSYRTNPDKRFLYGDYEGGAFALYTMFHQTDLFHGYIVNTPLLAGWSAFDEVERYAESHSDLPTSLFLSTPQGIVGLTDPFIASLHEQGFENLQIKYVVNEEESGLMMWPIGMQQGIQEIFRSSLWANE